MSSARSSLSQPLTTEAEHEEDGGKEARACCCQVVGPVLVYYAVNVLLAFGLTYAAYYSHFKKQGLVKELPSYRYMLPYEILATLCAISACFNACHHMFQHLAYNENGWKILRPTLFILCMVPVYAVCSCVALVGGMNRYGYAVLLTAFREGFEAIVLISFMQFMSEFWGGTLRLARLLDTNDLTLKACFESVVVRVDQLLAGCTNFQVGDVSAFFVVRRAPGSEYVAWTYIAELQYAFVMILYVLVNITLWLFTLSGRLDENDMEKYLQRIKFVKIASNFWAFWNLFVLFEYLRESENTKRRMDKIRPISKFFCIKLIVIVSLWQEQILTQLAHRELLPTFRGVEQDWVNQQKTAEGVVNFLVCIEMVLFAQWHRYAYTFEEKWSGGEKVAKVFRNTNKDYKASCCCFRFGVGKMMDDVGYLLCNRVNGQHKCVHLLQEKKRGGDVSVAEDSDLFRNFQYFELDDQGEASIAQIKYILVSSGFAGNMRDATEQLRQADRDSSGRLSYKEFIADLITQGGRP